MTKLGIQLHTGTTSLHKFKPVRNGGFTKPEGGFWTSSYLDGGNGWTDFCEGEDFLLPESGMWQGILLKPHADARIAVVDSMDDLLELFSRYPLQANTFMATLDYEAIALDFDAMHLTHEGQARTRFGAHLSLYGWDFESTVWFRQKFDLVKAIEFPVKKRSY